MENRRFLFLQLLKTPFFDELAQHLRHQGCSVERVAFCEFDRSMWRSSQPILFQGQHEEWPDFVEGLVAQSGITDVVLFGSCRPYHKTLFIRRPPHPLRIHSFDEGLLRPNWITVRSTLHRADGSLTRLKRSKASFDLQRAVDQLQGKKNLLVIRAYWELRSQMMSLLRWRGRFQHYHYHRLDRRRFEALGWGLKLLKRPWVMFRDRSRRRLYESGRCSYYFVPLQLPNDFSIRENSNYTCIDDFLDEVMESFARAAPPAARLLIKAHPLDNHLRNWDRLIQRLAQFHGIASRVSFIERGPTNHFCRHGEGLVLINSTTGMTALASGVPVHCCGRADYAQPGLVHQGNLDQFWSHDFRPDLDRARRYRDDIAVSHQYPASFFLTSRQARGADRVASGILSTADQQAELSDG